VQAVVFGFHEVLQDPVLQLGSRHWLEVEQPEHASPLSPHLESVVPVSQEFPSQQPVQQLPP
jgi:hypothetical protein